MLWASAWPASASGRSKAYASAQRPSPLASRPCSSRCWSEGYIEYTFPARHDSKCELLIAQLEQPRRPLAAADAHRHHAVAGLTPPHLVEDRAHQPRPGHAERVADG